VLCFIYSLMSAAFDLPRISFLLTDKERNTVRAGVVLLLLVHWAYLIILL
jgi:hypothetical protein